ncbi:MAG: UbiD family decarboxylase, partial [Candidatus Bathyarchaeia archaeon]
MSLRSFLEEMEKKGEVTHIRDRVSPRFEVSSIMKAFDGGPILFFDQVDGYDTKIVANVCGTRQRLCSALKVSPKDLYQRLVEAQRSPVAPKVVNEGAVKEVIKKPNLTEIPVLTHFERDAGAYITSAIVSTRSPDGTIENVSIHRLQVLDEDHLAIRLVPRHLYQMWKMAKEEKRDLEVAISLGLHPAVSLAAAMSPPFGVSEFGVANAFLERGMVLTKGEK